MKFAALDNLVLLIPMGILCIFGIYSVGKRLSILQKFCDKKLFDKILFNSSEKKYKARKILQFVSFLFILLSLIQPRYGFKWQEVRRHGLDLMVAIDVSKSMLAEDVKPSRLERAKREIRDLLEVFAGDRIGLVAFSGRAFVHSPLTLDYTALRLFIDELSPESISMGGTAIGEALLLSMKAFEGKSKKSKAVILITDGEDHSGKVDEAIKKAKETGVRIFSIGIGGPEGAPIPDKASGGFKKDNSGNLILSRVNEQALKKIASDTSGGYVRSVSGDLDIERLEKDLKSSLVDSEFEGGRRKIWIERFQWPLVIAILILFFENFMQVSRAMALIPLLFLFSQTAYAGLFSEKGVDDYNSGKYEKALKSLKESAVKDPDSRRKRYNLGNAFYKLKDFENAEKMFKASLDSKDQSLKKDSLYNLGNSFFRQKKYQEAVASYGEALKLDEKDGDIKSNLELAKKQLEKQKNQPKNDQEDQNNKDKQGKDDQDKKGSEDQKNESQKNKVEGNPENEKSKDRSKQSKNDPKNDDQKDNKKAKPKSADDEKEQNDKKSAQAEGENQDEKEKNSAEEPTEQAKTGRRKLSPAEAKRWLDMLKENKRKYLNRSMKGADAGARDW